MKNHESPLAQFHNQREGDFDESTGTIHEPGTLRHNNHLELKNVEKNKEAQMHLQNVISLIDNLQVSDLFKGDETEEELLQQKKNQAKRLILDVLTKAADYLNSVQAMDAVKLSKDDLDSDAYRKQLENSEDFRQRSHDALIANVNIANRFIFQNFGKIEEELQEEWEDKEEEAGRKIPHAKRVDFPPNGICTDRIDIKDRKEIAVWALQISRSLAEIKKRLSE